MKKTIHQWKKKVSSLIFSPAYIIELLLAIILIILSVSWQNMVSEYNDSLGIYSAVGDVLFTIIPSINLSYLYFGGMWIMVIIGSGYAIIKVPEKIPLGIFAAALFFFIRALCIASTNIGIPPDHIIPNIDEIDSFQFFRNDLFFSGHTGAPFLIALLIWKDIFWRNLFLIISVIMAFTVISMRLHYTIDIIGAYFITYGIFHIAEKLYEIFSSLLVTYQADKNKNNPPNNRNNRGPV